MSDTPPPITTPASFVTETAVAYADGSGRAVTVDRDHPLPVLALSGAAAAAPLAGTATASAQIGPFVAELGRPLQLRLWGTWSGSVRVLESVDGGTTKLTLTVGGRPWGGPYGANVNEEDLRTPRVAGQSFWLDATIASGTLAYWLGQ